MKKYSGVAVFPEMLIPELGESACGGNQRGGLGILAGDLVEGAHQKELNFLPITGFYDISWMTGEKIFYKKGSRYAFDIKVKVNGKEYVLKVMEAFRDGARVMGVRLPGVLYAPDRSQRLLQEVLLGHAPAAICKQINFKPDILWLHEGHVAIAAAAMKSDPYFNGLKTLFTTHTPQPEGLEKFFGFGNRFCELGIPSDPYYPVFVKDGMTIDMSRAAMIMSDVVNAVSEEHGRIAKEMFPEFADKITAVTNGSSRNLWLSPRIKALPSSPGPMEFWEAHQEDKREFLCQMDIDFDLKKPILGWVRRLAAYKNQYPMLKPIIRPVCASKDECVDTEYGRLEGLDIRVFGAGRPHESDTDRLIWMEEFSRWSANELCGKFVFLPQYNFQLLKSAAAACDIWLNCPWPKAEACGTSPQRAQMNGNINATSPAGGDLEYIEEYNPVTGEGNGFFINPYDSLTLYRKLKIISDLYYAWVEKGDDRWLKLMMNSFKSGKSLDILPVIARYEQIFEKLLS